MFLVTLSVPVYSFNNQTTTLWKSCNTTDNAVLQCLCLSFLALAPLNSLGLFSDIDECNAANNSCHENAWCNNTRGSFNCFCKPGHGEDKMADRDKQYPFMIALLGKREIRPTAFSFLRMWLSGWKNSEVISQSHNKPVTLRQTVLARFYFG